jgi:anti-sigma regulatory factor (Ser/Thr protein kinase)
VYDGYTLSVEEPTDAVSCELPPEARSAGLARRFVTEMLDSWQEPEASAETASLLVSELVTNAVLHAGSTVGLVVRRHGGRPRVEVTDCAPAAPEPRRHDDDATTGRGLEMVELLAEQWGVETGEESKTVWFEVAGDAAPAPGASGSASPTGGAATAPSAASSHASHPGERAGGRAGATDGTCGARRCG